MNGRIHVVSGPFSGKTFEISRGKLIVGREEDCHLRLDSEFVSRHHCALLLDDYTVRIRDLGSKNGTFVNGRRVGSGETILLHDDVVAIGEMTFQINLDQPDPGTQGLASSPAMEGTGAFEGDTAQADARPVVPSIIQRAD
jgi:pSer/pThr/pTyr-binding forkhead associated (FHA) protein